MAGAIPAEIVRTWCAARAVCLDVDSTVSRVEGLDELARFLGKAEEVTALTAAAMNGSMSFRQSLRARLDLLRPSATDVERFLRAHPPVATLDPHINALVAQLHAADVAVFLVSGGFTQIIEPIAAELSIPLSRVIANELLFDPGTGAYAGFNLDAPTSKSGGKLAVARQLRAAGHAPLVMVGDGATDLEARAADGSGADCFIGYGGTRVRERVQLNADAFVFSFLDLIALRPIQDEQVHLIQQQRKDVAAAEDSDDDDDDGYEDAGGTAAAENGILNVQLRATEPIGSSTGTARTPRLKLRDALGPCVPPPLTIPGTAGAHTGDKGKRARLRNCAAATVVASFEAVMLVSAYLAINTWAGAAQSTVLATVISPLSRGWAPLACRVLCQCARAAWVARTALDGTARALHVRRRRLTALMGMRARKKSSARGGSLGRAGTGHLSGPGAAVLTLQLVTGAVLLACCGRAREWATLSHWRVEDLGVSASSSVTWRLDWARIIDAVLLAPAREELLFRGLVWRIMANRCKSGSLCVVITNALFALSHLANAATAQQGMATVLLQVVAGFCAGSFYSALLATTGNWWECVLLHVANNALAAMVPAEEWMAALTGQNGESALNEGWARAVTLCSIALYATLCWYLLRTNGSTQSLGKSKAKAS